ncbi:thermonuclease family protein [Roseomonas fluvialis]
MLSPCSADVTAEATEFRARAEGVTDGDTITVLTEQRLQVRVRLAEIHAPERRHAFGHRARQMPTGRAFERRVLIAVTGIDRNRRVIGRVFLGSLDVNVEMARRGDAWVFRVTRTVPPCCASRRRRARRVTVYGHSSKRSAWRRGNGVPIDAVNDAAGARRYTTRPVRADHSRRNSTHSAVRIPLTS